MLFSCLILFSSSSSFENFVVCSSIFLFSSLTFLKIISFIYSSIFDLYYFSSDISFCIMSFTFIINYFNSLTYDWSMKIFFLNLFFYCLCVVNWNIPVYVLYVIKIIQCEFIKLLEGQNSGFIPRTLLFNRFIFMKTSFEFLFFIEILY